MFIEHGPHLVRWFTQIFTYFYSWFTHIYPLKSWFSTHIYPLKSWFSSLNPAFFQITGWPTAYPDGVVARHWQESYVLFAMQKSGPQWVKQRETHGFSVSSQKWLIIDYWSWHFSQLPNETHPSKLHSFSHFQTPRSEVSLFLAGSTERAEGCSDDSWGKDYQGMRKMAWTCSTRSEDFIQDDLCHLRREAGPASQAWPMASFTENEVLEARASSDFWHIPCQIPRSTDQFVNLNIAIEFDDLYISWRLSVSCKRSPKGSWVWKLVIW